MQRANGFGGSVFSIAVCKPEAQESGVGGQYSGECPSPIGLNLEELYGVSNWSREDEDISRHSIMYVPT